MRPESPNPKASASCSPEDRAAVHTHRGELVEVEGRPAIIIRTIVIRGQIDCVIEVRLLTKIDGNCWAPVKIQDAVDRLDFTPAS